MGTIAFLCFSLRRLNSPKNVFFSDIPTELSQELEDRVIKGYQCVECEHKLFSFRSFDHNINSLILYQKLSFVKSTAQESQSIPCVIENSAII